MKTVLAVLVILYLVALHTSMAGMEIFAWAVTLTSFGYQFAVKRDFAVFRANRTLNLWFVALTVSIAIGLLLNPAYRPFIFQIGFMRWTVVLWGLTFALQEVWSDAFEQSLLFAWMILVILTGINAGIQCFTGVDFVREGAVEFQSDRIFKAVGWFSESLSFAYNFGVSVFALAKPAWNRRSPFWATIVCTCGGLGLVSAVSRGAWLAAIVTVLLYFAFTNRKLVLPAAGFFYGLSKLLMWYSAGFGGKIEGLEHMKVDHSSGVRIDLWRGYFAMWLDHPFFGVGIKQGDLFLPEYFAKLGIHQEFVSHAHNNFLQFLAGAGIFGFVAYCAISFIFLRKAWRIRNVTVWGWSLLLAQIFMHLGGLTQANFIDAIVNHMLVFTWALLLATEARMVKMSALTKPG